MRSSHILPIWNSRLVLREHILEALNMRRDCHLYGVVQPDAEGNSLILSTIPVAYWSGSYRIEVYTAAKIGSLAAATGVLESEGVDILTCWAASMSADGQLCFTAIVRFAGRKGIGRRFNHRAWAERVEKRLSAEEALSPSSIFTGEDPLRRVRMIRLQVLDRLARLNLEEIELDVHDYTIILPERRSASPRNGLKQAAKLTHSPLLDVRSGGRSQVHGDRIMSIVTADSHDNYLRIALLAQGDYRRISFELNKRSGLDDFRGFVDCAASTCRHLNLNVILLKVSVVQRTPGQAARRKGHGRVSAKSSGRGECRERSRYSIICDISRYLARGLTETALCTEFESTLRTNLREASGDERTCELVKISQRPGERPERLTIGAIEDIRPLIFIASNVKPSMMVTRAGRRHVDLVLRIIHALKHRGLHPVNVEIANQGRSGLRSQIENLIELCPLMISINLPEAGNELKRRTSAGSYAPSDYTLYEEATMLARPTGSVIRLRHRAVFGGRFLGDTPEVVFDDSDLRGAALDRLLRNFANRLRRHLTSVDFKNERKRCGELQSLRPAEWDERDIEGWLTESATSAGSEHSG